MHTEIKCSTQHLHEARCNCCIIYLSGDFSKKKTLLADILAFWESRVVVENSFKEEVRRFKMILKRIIGKLHHSDAAMSHVKGEKIRTKIVQKHKINSQL